MYKITEKFVSLQGEGYWVGTPMAFIRLSQCPVGGTHGMCTLEDGRSFPCDTGPAHSRHVSSDPEWHSYTEVNDDITADQVVDWSLNQKVGHVCFTGGEPLIYDLSKIFIKHVGIKWHLETSGTIDQIVPSDVWVTVSPKEKCLPKMLQRANEIKVIVHKDTPRDLIAEYMNYMKPVYLQPLMDDDYEPHLAKARELCMSFPNRSRLSLQTHKFIGIR